MIGSWAFFMFRKEIYGSDKEYYNTCITIKLSKSAYITFLRRLCQSFDLKVTNNHALRMSLNSNVLIPLGISVADRAAMLGHSIETNLKCYSFARKGYLDEVRVLLDGGSNQESLEETVEICEGTSGEHSNVVQFSKKRSPKTLNSQRFQAL